MLVKHGGGSAKTETLVSISDEELNVSHTLEDLMAVTKFFKISAMYSTGGDTAERTYKTAELYICKSELSLSSDIRRISGLGRRSEPICKVIRGLDLHHWNDVWENQACLCTVR